MPVLFQLHPLLQSKHHRDTYPHIHPYSLIARRHECWGNLALLARNQQLASHLCMCKVVFPPELCLLQLATTRQQSPPVQGHVRCSFALAASRVPSGQPRTPVLQAALTAPAALLSHSTLQPAWEARDS